MKSALKTILITQALISASFGMIGPIYAIFVQEIGGGILTAGGAVAAFSIATGLMLLLISRWEDHVKHLEKMAVASYFLSSIGFLSYIFVNNVYKLFAVQVLLGLSIAIRDPALVTLYSKNLDHGKNTSEWGEWSAILYISTAIAALVGGYIAKFYGFKILFSIMFLSSLISLIYSFRLFKKK